VAGVAVICNRRNLMSENTTEDLIYMDVPAGRVVIRLRPDLAPKAAERIRTLAEQGFYDNVPFHRVISGFMAQGGDPTGTGMHGSDLPDLPAEFTSKAKFERGTIGMARTADPNSANSQFFIMFEPSPHLDGQYTIVGEVIEGMENVDKIKRGAGGSGMVNDPDRIARMRPTGAEG
jgi:cyclophilin family peptidyl-prolyl cis-trans isomerase